MSYVDSGLKFMVGCIVGFILGIAAAVILSPMIMGDRFLIPIVIITTIGFPVLLCTRASMRSLLVTVGVAIALLVTAIFISFIEERFITYSAMNSIQRAKEAR